MLTKKINQKILDEMKKALDEKKKLKFDMLMITAGILTVFDGIRLTVRDVLML